MTLLRAWTDFTIAQALAPRSVQAGRKVVRGVSLTVSLDDTLTLQHAAYGEGHGEESKMSLLRRYYRNENSIAMAVRDFAAMVPRRAFNSVGFNTYGAVKKGYTTQGQCMQAVAVTLVQGQAEIDVHYRTADLVMRFPADLVFLRDDLLPPFAAHAPIGAVRCSFANASIDSNFYWILFPHIPDVLRHLEDLRQADRRLWRGVMTSIGYYLTNRHIKFERFQRQKPKFLAMNSPEIRADLLDYYQETSHERDRRIHH